MFVYIAESFWNRTDDEKEKWLDLDGEIVWPQEKAWVDRWHAAFWLKQSSRGRPGMSQAT
jgi:hypothetical protein